MYQPLPLKESPGGEISFVTVPGHWAQCVIGASENFWMTSNRCLHSLQMYSYSGITTSRLADVKGVELDDHPR